MAPTPDQSAVEDNSNNYDTRVITTAEAGDTITQLPTRMLTTANANFAKGPQPAGFGAGADTSNIGAADPQGPLPPQPVPLNAFQEQHQQLPVQLAAQAPQLQLQMPMQQQPQLQQVQQPQEQEQRAGGGGGGVGGLVRRMLGSLRRGGRRDRQRPGSAPPPPAADAAAFLLPQQQQQQQQQAAAAAPLPNPSPQVLNMLQSGNRMTVPQQTSRRLGGYDTSGLRGQTTRQALARTILLKASELPLPRRHELVAAAASDPDLALLFSAGPEQPVPFVPSLDAKLSSLLKQVTAQSAPQPPADDKAEQQSGKEQQQEEEEPLTLRLVPEYEQYGLGAGEAVRAVVSLKAAADVKQRAHVALTCVLDRSGSMSGERIELVRETCHFLIDQLSPDDYLGLVSYAGGVREDVPLLRMTPEARSLAHAMVDALDADGSTALYDGLVAGVRQQMEAEVEMKKQAAAAVAGAPAGGRLVHSCFLFTDGEATDGPRDPPAILAGLAALQAPTDQHVTVHTFGFGAGHSVQLLQAVADAQSGVYYYISCVDDIPNGFGDALGGLLAVVAKDVRVGVRAAPNISLTAFRSGGRVLSSATAAASSLASAAAVASAQGRARSAAQRRPQPGVSSAAAAAAPPAVPTATAFNDMFAEESRECLLTLTLPAAAVPAGADGHAGGDGAVVVLCHVDLEYTDVATGRRRQATAALTVTRRAAPRPADALPAELVFVTAARFETLDAIEAAEAAAAAATGSDLSVAHGVLDAHAARLQAAPIRGNATLTALATQTHTARASLKPRYEFNQEGVATVAGTKQALKQQRIGTGTTAAPAMFQEYDHKAKANFRCTTSAGVQAKAWSSRAAGSS
ncbi:hypothetical protein HYH02_004013 [Chlamydomonas schloesseri]|uniref:VWFA domain-containing protein n=1 Tax=Chlamydomonas schloesseri TaxID=2026947 RepID=A0A835WQ87_9CHLO|nr:hypothetical protein HYH02_004013 [Chlamydomonas schloesseri]|eukprot:KAG2451414.1 hypothetical protein HYH02_004013 [Chlamydomonas schloesseri]